MASRRTDPRPRFTGPRYHKLRSAAPSTVSVVKLLEKQLGVTKKDGPVMSCCVFLRDVAVVNVVLVWVCPSLTISHLQKPCNLSLLLPCGVWCAVVRETGTERVRV